MVPEDPDAKFHRVSLAGIPELLENKSSCEMLDPGAGTGHIGQEVSVFL